ncbi:MAG TPA: phosphate signaling complex protein PhoU [Bacteroidota bacterium]|jgi:phosphate transport system protein|nr:phosphate signaling complex protein PhoU [Bacteroidota bacterium]
MVRHFEQELDDLKTNLIKMGSLVDEQIDAACEALFGAHVEVARHVIALDRRVDEFDTLIDKECQRIFALAQPVAIDLRLLMSALKINNELERIGDIAVNIAERVDPLVPFNEFLRTTRLHEMASIARIMVRDSLDAFIHNNPGLATRVLESDDVVDNLDRHIFRQLVLEMQSNPPNVVPASHIMILSRHVERLADHATNIAEDVIFLVDARIVKHNAFEEDRTV